MTREEFLPPGRREFATSVPTRGRDPGIRVHRPPENEAFAVSGGQERSAVDEHHVGRTVRVAGQSGPIS
jgi:hypothetical protein